MFRFCCYEAVGEVVGEDNCLVSRLGSTRDPAPFRIETPRDPSDPATRNLMPGITMMKLSEACGFEAFSLFLLLCGLAEPAALHGSGTAPVSEYDVVG